jgi:hypothetical protein
MQLTFSAAISVPSAAQTHVHAAGPIADGAYWIADGAYRIELFPQRPFRGTQLKVVRRKAGSNASYDGADQAPRTEPLGAVIGATRPSSNRVAAIVGAVEPSGPSLRLSSGLEQPWPRRFGELAAGVDDPPDREAGKDQVFADRARQANWSTRVPCPGGSGGSDGGL